MEKKNGFTLIELLAVIIILGILMIIAIPSVTKYISDSRKNAYVDTAKEIVAGTRNKVNDGKLGMFDTNVTYYIPSKYIKTENASKSPYGEFTEAYIGIIYDGKGYKYYWISVDDAGQGVRNITPIDKLDTDDIESDLTNSDITGVIETTGIGNRNKILILNQDTEEWREVVGGATNHVSEEEGGGASSGSNNSTQQTNYVCKKATVLHTDICTRTGDGCYDAGYTNLATGLGTTITYGTIVNGIIKSGDAFDCDVNYDGVFDSSTERFYYVTSDGDKSILLFYNNVNNNTGYDYDSSGENWHGPRTAYQYLPSTSEWKNPGLIAPGTRIIKNEVNGNTTTGGTIETFTYVGKAARFLTLQELITSCPTLSSSNLTTNGAIDGCVWANENVGTFLDPNGKSGYWLETPVSFDNKYAYDLYGRQRKTGYYDVSSSSKYYTVRPVITVKTINIEY